MTSKEALEKLEKLLKYLPYAVNYKLYHDTIVKDLNRLEELEEKSKEIYKRNYELIEENAKLKKVIDKACEKLEWTCPFEQKLMF